MYKIALSLLVHMRLQGHTISDSGACRVPEGHVWRPLVQVPRALVHDVPGSVPEERPRCFLEFYPWLQRLGRRNGQQRVHCQGDPFPVPVL